MGKFAPNGTKRDQEFVFPTIPDLANILGRTDFDFENLYVLGFFWIPKFWISRFQNSWISKIPTGRGADGWAGGRARAGGRTDGRGGAGGGGGGGAV